MRVKAVATARMTSGVDLLSIELLEQHARRLAALFSIEPRGGGNRRAHLRQLSAHMRALRAVYTALADEAAREAVSPAAEWLLDNFHLVAAAARDIQHDLPPSFFKRLPLIVSDEFAGIRASMRSRSNSSDRAQDGSMHSGCSGHQRIPVGHAADGGRALGVASVLKLALLDHLRARGDALAEARLHQLAADRMAAAIEASVGTVEEWPADIHHTFVTRLLQRSRALGALASRLHQQLEHTLAERGQSIEDAIRAEGQHQAAEHATVANLITSLRLITTFDWSEFFESVSLVEQDLSAIPRVSTARWTFAAATGIDTPSRIGGADRRKPVAARVEKRRTCPTGTLRAPESTESHVGHHLIGRGRPQFEQSVAWKPDVRDRIRRLCFAWATAIYLGTIAVGTALFVTIAVNYAAAHGWRGSCVDRARALDDGAGQRTHDSAAAADHQLCAPAAAPASARARRGPSPTARTMVIVPTLLDSVERVDASHRAPGGAGARQRRSPRALRASHRLSRRAD